MNIVYPLDCNSSLQHACTPCPASEGGRISGIGLIRTDFVFTDIENPLEWNLGIYQNRIKIIPDVSGIYDEVSVTMPRCGFLPQRILYKNCSIKLFDSSFRNNCGFYNRIMSEVNYRIAFISDTVLQISDNAVTIKAKDSIDGDVLKSRVWDMEFEWWQYSTPSFYTAPLSVFDCNAKIPQFLLTEDGDVILTEDGTPILLEFDF